MKGLAYLGNGEIRVVERTKPTILATTDAIVKMLKTTICGTDMHILQDHVPTFTEGRILGHEGVGVVESVGSSVTAFVPGDVVVIACITSCGTCSFCRRGILSHCSSGGWVLGHTDDGTQAEYVRVQQANISLHHAPKGVDLNVLVLASDILETGLECGAMNGRVQPGASVAVVGAGPVGLSALMASQLFSPSVVISIDLDENRLAAASAFGATHTVRSGSGTVKQVMEITNGLGVDTVIEAVGSSVTFELCQQLVAVGGTIANIGVHGAKADLHLENLWNRNIMITTRLIDTVTTPTVLKLLESGRLNPKGLITHYFRFQDILQGYNTFRAAAQNKALKVIIDFD
ncbi:zinc-dependent alcohol dehydrogenase [Wolfiporia cocos MD-104 SS10]|uniref:Zinc-dependent alcohol dehydrogenase n=1 Tax=Wolfiporia cocos (strain MD-104) TaxID=742152 RepID=A0A2H3JM88_WOLCO|nr:zinc-dependent alcohol dehydrogenase [Wolfiporia cocos MD-104 SS10]